MAKKVITFGEIMLRLAPEGYYRFVQADTFGATYGGGEANVAVSLANYGFDAKFVTKLPAHEIGQAAVNSLRKYGVDTSYIARGGDRVGIYFLEKGASSVRPRSSMTARDLPSRPHPHPTSTGRRSSTEQTGSTSQASPRPSTTMWPRSAWRPARQQKKPALRFPAT